MLEAFAGLGFLTQVFVVLAAFSSMIFVHELGHFAAARLVGVRVERFFVGFDIFGLSISKKVGDTLYGLGALPLGGYVALAGQNDDPRKEVVKGDADELRSKSLWAQMLVFASGALMNFVFALVLFFLANLRGIPFIPAVLGEMPPDMPAALHGLQTGDRVVAIDNRSIRNLEEMHAAIVETPPGREMVFTVLRRRPGADPDDQPNRLSLRVRGQAGAGRGQLNTIGVAPPISTTIAEAGSMPVLPGLRGWLSPGDQIVAVDGEPMGPDDGARVRQKLLHWPDETVSLAVRRAGSRQIEQLPSVPLSTFGPPDIGFLFGFRVLRVNPGSAAMEAGIGQGDTIVAMALPPPSPGGSEAAMPGAAAETPRQSIRPLLFRQPGDFAAGLRGSALREISVAYVRGGAEGTADVRPRLLPGSLQHERTEDTLLGMVVGWAEEPANGIRIEALIAGSPADGLLEPGDIIRSAGGIPFDEARHHPAWLALRLATEESSMAPITLYVARKGAAALSPEQVAARRAWSREGDAEALLSDDSLEAVAARLRLDQNDRPLLGVEYGHQIIGVWPDARHLAISHLAEDQWEEGAQLALRPIAQGLPDMIPVAPGLSHSLVTMLPAPAIGGPPGWDSGARRARTLLLPLPESYRQDPVGSGLVRQLDVAFQMSQEIQPHSAGAAMAIAGGQWWNSATMVFRYLRKLVVGELKVEAMGGPIKLMEVIGVADNRGFGYLLYIVALISINLGICNLLPFPVLDGGHLMFLLYEAVFRRKPNERVRVGLQYAGLALLLTLMATVSWHDLKEWLNP